MNYDIIAKSIKEADSIVICGHIRPDGDCYGAQMGLKEAILTNFPEKKVYCVGTGMPIFFDYINKMDDVTDEIIENSLAIIVDLNELYRIEDQRVPNLAKKMVLIDHHIKMIDYGFPTLINENACSTCEIVCSLLESQHWKINEKGANALYLGILTDSAHFEFVDDFPHVFKIAAYLCELGARPDVINRILSMTNERFVRIKGYAMTHYKKRKGGIIYLHLKQKDLDRLHIKQSYGSAIVNTFGNIKGYPIWLTMLENEERTCIIEFRSNVYNVCNTAMKYGGGGHTMAAGVTIRNFNAEIKNAILNDLEKIVKESE